MVLGKNKSRNVSIILKPPDKNRSKVFVPSAIIITLVAADNQTDRQTTALLPVVGDMVRVYRLICAGIVFLLQ